jgi:glycosyltransferase involved in cell wall biosynthesis
VVKAELAATLLINPRPSHEDYTKYSFPSKNMEYMASGTPVLTTRLPGMPDDHKPYVYLIEREDATGIQEALQRILAQDARTIHAFGMCSKNYILREKNNIAQASKIVRFVRSHFKIC